MVRPPPPTSTIDRGHLEAVTMALQVSFSIVACPSTMITRTWNCETEWRYTVVYTRQGVLYSSAQTGSMSFLYTTGSYLPKYGRYNFYTQQGVLYSSAQKGSMSFPFYKFHYDIHDSCVISNIKTTLKLFLNDSLTIFLYPTCLQHTQCKYLQKSI